jgi:virulence-associated protein VapD
MYAILIVIDKEALAGRHPDVSVGSVEGLIEEFLAKHGLSKHAESLYLGDDLVGPVSAVLAIQELVREYLWLDASTVSKATMLRIGETSDLSGVLVDIEIRRMLEW